MTYWPASSSTTPRYAGPVSFFRLPTLSNPADADIALIGLPYDGGTTVDFHLDRSRFFHREVSHL